MSGEAVDVAAVNARWVLARMAGESATDARRGWDDEKINALVNSWQDIPALLREVGEARVADDARAAANSAAAKERWRRAWKEGGPVTILPEPGRFVRRPPMQRHRCQLPAEWPIGALWRCQDGHLWMAKRTPNPMRYGYTPDTTEWVPASWWQRHRHGGVKASLSMGNENRVLTARHFRPPSSCVLRPEANA